MREAHAARKAGKQRSSAPQADKKWPFNFTPEIATEIMLQQVRGTLKNYLALNPTIKDEALSLVESKKVVIETIGMQEPIDQRTYLVRLTQVWREKYGLGELLS